MKIYFFSSDKDGSIVSAQMLPPLFNIRCLPDSSGIPVAKINGLLTAAEFASLQTIISRISITPAKSKK